MNQSDLKFQYGQTQKQMLSEKKQAERDKYSMLPFMDT